MFFRRIIVVTVTALAILFTAQSCNLFPSPKTSNSNDYILGVLKKDPAIKQDGFVVAGAVKTLNGNVDKRGISTLSGIKLVQSDTNTLYFLATSNSTTGIFKSDDQGRLWNRLYVFPISTERQGNEIAGAKVNDKAIDQKTADANYNKRLETDLADNNSFYPTDVVVDPQNKEIIYVSGVLDGIGRVYKSSNGGQNFKEVYQELEDKVSVSFVTIDPSNSLKVFAVLQEGALIKSIDGGNTWSKIRAFRDNPVQIGFIPEFNRMFYVLFEKTGLATSSDEGLTWLVTDLTKNASQIGEDQNKDGLDLSFSDIPSFGRYEKIIPVTAGITYDPVTSNITNNTGNWPWLLIADSQMWYTTDIKQPFNKLVLPVQSEKYNLTDINFHPNFGLDRIYTSVDNRLFETNNRGKSWDVKDQIGFESSIGNIGQILIDKSNTENMYLLLVDYKVRRTSGVLGF